MHVAISKELISRVEVNIAEMLKQELDAATPNFDREYSVDASHIYNVAQFKDHIDLLDKIPKKWLHKTDRGRMNIKFDYVKDNTLTLSETTMFFNSLTSAYSRPCADYPGYISNPTVQDHVVAKLPDGTPGKAEVMQRVADAKVRCEIIDRWKKIENEVVGFLKQCKSLNEAVKLVPNIKLYVNPEDIERLERKVERKVREQVTVNIDVDAITASAVAARLQQAA